MDFINHTPFPALAFEGIDQHGQSFHVVVLRQTLTFASGQLAYADVQAPLCEVDTFFGEMNASSVRQESDLCQFKPRCDIIVNATAHAPQGRPVPRFKVAVQVRLPDRPAPLPEPPSGLNPMQSAGYREMSAWREATRRAAGSVITGRILLDKSLTVTGERSFRKTNKLMQCTDMLLKWGTLGTVRGAPWQLTAPEPFLALPLRHEYAWGGQCRINAGDKASEHVDKKLRLTPEELAGHPDGTVAPLEQPVAHRVCEPNPVGRGFAQDWHLAVVDVDEIPAPRIEHPTAPITVALFDRVRSDKTGEVAIDPAGFGIRAKVHPERCALLGTVDDAFIQSPQWLPDDFDFAIWNAAPPDQQIDYPRGDETIALTNLCPPGTPGATVDAQGDTVLELALLKHECFVLVRMASGEMFSHPMSIDTVLIEPDEQTLTLVWRIILSKTDNAPLRVCETRMRTNAARAEERPTTEMRSNHDDVAKEMTL